MVVAQVGLVLDRRVLEVEVVVAVVAAAGAANDHQDVGHLRSDMGCQVQDTLRQLKPMLKPPRLAQREHPSFASLGCSSNIQPTTEVDPKTLQRTSNLVTFDLAPFVMNGRKYTIEDVQVRSYRVNLATDLIQRPEC